MTNNHPSTTDVVDVAVKSLRETPVPDGPPPVLVALTLDALHACGPGIEEPPSRGRSTRMLHLARYGSLTAAATAVALLVGWMTFSPNTSRVAFGEVIRELKAAGSVQFTLTTLANGVQIPARWWIRGDQLRMEYPGQAVFVFDLKTKQSVQIDLVHKTARRTTVSSEAAEQSRSILHELTHLQPEGARPLDDEELDGRKALVYEVDDLGDVRFLGLESAEACMKLWVDPESKLPVRIVVQVVSTGENIRADTPFDTTLTFDDFEWNKPLDASLFSLQVPEGFSVQESPAPSQP